MMVGCNVALYVAYRGMSRATAAIARSTLRLSSGLRIDSAADDPAGLAISEKMRAQIRGLETAKRSAQDGISVIQTAEGALYETHSMLHRVRELVIMSGSGGLSDSDRRTIQDEIEQLIQEMDEIAKQTGFSGTKLIDGSRDPDQSPGLWLQLGANAGEGLYVVFGNMSAGVLGSGAAKGFALDGVDIFTRLLDDNLAVVDQAIEDVSRERGRIGAYANRLEHRISYLETAAENLIAAESRIRDADMAKEIMSLVRNEILHEVALHVFELAREQSERMLEPLMPEDETAV